MRNWEYLYINFAYLCKICLCTDMTNSRRKRRQKDKNENDAKARAAKIGEKYGSIIDVWV